MGEVDLSVDDDTSPVFEDEIIQDPTFYVVDDMYNAHSQLAIVESEPGAISLELIQSLHQLASAFPNWYVQLNLGDCGLSIFGDKVLVGGRRFRDCTTVHEIAERCARMRSFGGY